MKILQHCTQCCLQIWRHCKLLRALWNLEIAAFIKPLIDWICSLAILPVIVDIRVFLLVHFVFCSLIDLINNMRRFGAVLCRGLFSFAFESPYISTSKFIVKQNNLYVSITKIRLLSKMAPISSRSIVYERYGKPNEVSLVEPWRSQKRPHGLYTPRESLFYLISIFLGFILIRDQSKSRTWCKRSVSQMASISHQPIGFD